MIYIKKRRTPISIKKASDNIKKDPASGYRAISLPGDTSKLRELFERMPKNEIRENLFKEQHGICAYCMRSINFDASGMKIEHYKALSKDKNAALDYQNYLGVCYGGEKEEDDRNRILCCDASRGEKDLKINPRDDKQMKAIAYRRNGEIYIRETADFDERTVRDLQDDIDKVLHLNGKKDDSGRIIRDTSTKIVATRRSMYDSVSTEFSRWEKKKCLTSTFLQSKIDILENELKNDNVAQPFIGVKLYRYKKKCDSLKRQHK